MVFQKQQHSFEVGEQRKVQVQGRVGESEA